MTVREMCIGISFRQWSLWDHIFIMNRLGNRQCESQTELSGSKNLCNYVSVGIHTQNSSVLLHYCLYTGWFKIPSAFVRTLVGSVKWCKIPVYAHAACAVFIVCLSVISCVCTGIPKLLTKGVLTCSQIFWIGLYVWIAVTVAYCCED